MITFLMEWFNYHRFDTEMLLIHLLHAVIASNVPIAQIADELMTATWFYYVAARLSAGSLDTLARTPAFLHERKMSFTALKQDCLDGDLYEGGRKKVKEMTKDEISEWQASAKSDFIQWLAAGLLAYSSEDVFQKTRDGWLGKPAPTGLGFVCKSSVWNPFASGGAVHEVRPCEFVCCKAEMTPCPANLDKEKDFDMLPAYGTTYFAELKPMKTTTSKAIGMWLTRGEQLMVAAKDAKRTWTNPGIPAMGAKGPVRFQGKTSVTRGDRVVQVDHYHDDIRNQRIQMSYSTSVTTSPFGCTVSFFKPFFIVALCLCLCIGVTATSPQLSARAESTFSVIPALRSEFLDFNPGKGVCSILLTTMWECEATHPQTVWGRDSWCINKNFTEPTFGEVILQQSVLAKRWASATATSLGAAASGLLRFCVHAMAGLYLNASFATRAFILLALSFVLFITLLWVFTFFVYAWRAATTAILDIKGPSRPAWLDTILYWILPGLIYNWLFTEHHKVATLQVDGHRLGPVERNSNVPESAIKDAGYVQVGKVPPSLVAVSILIGDRYVHHGWGARIKWKKTTGLLVSTHQANEMRSGAGDSFVITNAATGATVKVSKSQITTLASAKRGDLTILSFHQRFWSTLGVSAANLMPLKHKVKVYAFYSMNDGKAYLQTTRLAPYEGSLSGRIHYASTRPSDSGTPIYTTDGANIAAVHVAGGHRDAFGFATYNIASSVSGLCVLAGLKAVRKETEDYDPEEQWDARWEEVDRAEKARERLGEDEDEYYDYEENVLMRVKRDLDEIEDEEEGNEFRPKIRGSVWDTPLKGANWADDDEDYEVHRATFYESDKETLNSQRPPQGGHSSSSTVSVATSGAPRQQKSTVATSSIELAQPSSLSTAESEPKPQPSTTPSLSSVQVLKLETTGPMPGPIEVLKQKELPSDSKPEPLSQPTTEPTLGQLMFQNMIKQMQSLEDRLSSLTSNLENSAKSSPPPLAPPTPKETKEQVPQKPEEPQAPPTKPKEKPKAKKGKEKAMEVVDPKAPVEKKPKYTEEQKARYKEKMKQQAADAKAFREMMKKKDSSSSSGAQSSAPPPSIQKEAAAASSTGPASSGQTSSSG